MWHKGKGQGYYFQSASCCTVLVIRIKKTRLRWRKERSLWELHFHAFLPAGHCNHQVIQPIFQQGITKHVKTNVYQAPRLPEDDRHFYTSCGCIIHVKQHCVHNCVVGFSKNSRTHIILHYRQILPYIVQVLNNSKTNPDQRKLNIFLANKLN